MVNGVQGGRTGGEQPGSRPLSGGRVVECATGKHGSTGRYLAELGADVILVEPPGGAADRSDAPSAGGTSLAFAARNTSKRSVFVDLRTADGKEQFERLLANADILLEGASAVSAGRGLID